MTSAGSATIIGIAGLENARRVADTSSYMFDAQFYVTEDQTLIVALRYFNDAGLVFKPGDVGTYMVVAHVCMSPFRQFFPFNTPAGREDK
jgi:hypothetical protein